MSFSFSALSRDMRPPTVPVRPAPTWTPSPTPSPSLSLSLWRVVVCKLFASLLSRGINLQAIDRCCQRASQAKRRTDRQRCCSSCSSYCCPPSPASLHFYGKTKLFTQLPPLSVPLSPSLAACSLAAIVHAGIGQRSFIASCGSGRWL